MRFPWSILALALTGCLALAHHEGPWHCESNTDCRNGETCQSGTCQAHAQGSSGDAGPNGTGFCCEDAITHNCQCYEIPKIVCQSDSDGRVATCRCTQYASEGSTDGGATDSCSLRPLPWAACCLSTLEGSCRCSANGSCGAQETPVQSCSAAATGATGVGCQVSLDVCTCDSLFSPGAPQCPSELSPICCQSASDCTCSYNSSCGSSEQQVESCNASALQPIEACGTLQTRVTSCP